MLFCLVPQHVVPKLCFSATVIIQASILAMEMLLPSVSNGHAEGRNCEYI